MDKPGNLLYLVGAKTDKQVKLEDPYASETRIDQRCTRHSAFWKGSDSPITAVCTHF